MNYVTDKNVITVYYARALYARATLNADYTVGLELLGGYRDKRADKRLQAYAQTLESFANKYKVKEPDPAALVQWFFRHQVEAFQQRKRR